MLLSRNLARVSASLAVMVVVLGPAAKDTWADEAVPESAQAAPIPSADAAKRMTVPEGFKVTLCAAEPDVRQPIAFTIDPKGRLWVAESFSYPNWLQPPKENDRILIFEDRDGDGTFDHRSIFWDKGGKVSNVSGLAFGFGGVWVCATPKLLFIPDRDGNDIADGDPEVALDGWDLNARHNIFNGLNWGPDGWLYGCNGILSNSKVGVPGTPEAARVALNCGVWRFHPTRKTFEAVAHGTTNPWGLDFDDYGEAYITNCVIPHLFRVVPGSHFQRMFGPDINPHSYGLLESCADHIHWAGGHWTDSRGGGGKHGEAGGGHAHVGAMLYLGDNWPDAYRNSVFTCNVHGHRINRDTLERSGSSYVAKHGKDFLFANDTWFRGLELKYGPDGAVYLTDWSDMGECHETDGDLAHRENGRIFKVSYGTPRPVKVDLAALSDEELVQLQLHKNDWYVRNARRLLQERAARGKDLSKAHGALRAIFETNSETTRKLRALWTLYATEGLSPDQLRDQLAHQDEYVRNWAVRLLVDSKTPDRRTLDAFARMAREDRSPLVRLSLASALQRIPVDQRRGIAEGLIAHSEDVRDPYLPLMVWYGVEPLVPVDKGGAVSLVQKARIPLVRRYVARRLVLSDDAPEAKTAPSGLARLIALLEESKDPALQADLLAGILEALRGRKGLVAPEGWPKTFASLSSSGDAGVREQGLLLALLFNDPKAVTILKKTVADSSTPADERHRALQSLVENRAPAMAGTLQALVSDKVLKGAAIRGLAAFEDEATPGLLLGSYGSFNEEERADAINTLATRASTAKVLLDAVAKGTIPKRDLNASVARQLQAFGDPKITARLEEVWGSVRPTSSEKAMLIAKYKAMITPDRMKSADPSRGRALFNRTCLQCHKLFDSGGDVGPELTGSDRANPDYILENVLDPSATVGRDYRLNTIATTDGRLISGILRDQTDKTLVVQTVNERIVLPRDEVEELKPSEASMMPEGALEKLSPEEVRDLISYLGSKTQVPVAGN